MNSDVDNKINKIIEANTPKKRKGFSWVFYAVIIVAIISTAISVYGIKKTENDLGFNEEKTGIFEVLKQNINEFIF